MVENTLENKEKAPKTVPTAQTVAAETTPTSTASSENPPPQATAKSSITPPMSKGEKLYTWGVYSGINYWLNLASSVVIADYFCNLKGKDILSKGAEKIGKAVASTNLATYEKAFHNSKTALKTLTLLSGGWLLIIPIKLMEDNKRPMVHWLNKKMGVDQTDANGKELKSDEIYIECEQPKQSWLNVIMRRTVATLAVVGVGHGINAAFRNREKTKTYIGEEDPHGGKAVVEKFVVDNVNKAMKSGYIPGGKSFTQNPTAQRYLGLAALDTVFTKITAVIMQFTNGAQKAQMPHEKGDDAAPSASETSIDHLNFVKPEYEDTRAKPTAAPTHAERIRSKKPVASGINPEKYRKQAISSAEDLITFSDQGKCSPHLLG